MSTGPTPEKRMPVRDVNCAPFVFSSDEWRRRRIWSLKHRAARQVTPPEHSAALLLGSGDMPFFFSFFRGRRAVVSDLHRHVIDTTIEGRYAKLQDHRGWGPYKEDFINLDPGISHYCDPKKEFERAQKSGLMGDYELTRQRAVHTTVEGLEGNILVTAPELAGRLITADQVITYVNFTNAADYCGSQAGDYHGGRRALRQHVLDVLPRANDMIIVDSAPDLNPRLYSYAEYGN